MGYHSFNCIVIFAMIKPMNINYISFFLDIEWTMHPIWSFVGTLIGIASLIIGGVSLWFAISINKKQKTTEEKMEALSKTRTMKDSYEIRKGPIVAAIEKVLEDAANGNNICRNNEVSKICKKIELLNSVVPALDAVIDNLKEAKEIMSSGTANKGQQSRLNQILSGWSAILNQTYNELELSNPDVRDEIREALKTNNEQ